MMKSITHGKDLFQNIFEASIEGIILVNEDGRILVANPACEKLFGYNIGELIGESIDILIPKKLQLQYKVYIKKHIAPPKRDTDIWGIKKDGSKFSLNIGLSPTTIDDKNATIAFFWDSTQQKNDLKVIKQTNAKLVESNRKFDALINNQKGIVFRCKNNKNYDMDFISEGCLDITGYSISAFKTQTIVYGHLILKEDRDQTWESIQDSIRQKNTYSVEYRITHKNGEIKYVWEKGEGIYNDQNNIIMLEGFITDVTSQKETEVELRNSEAKIKALLEAIPDMIFIQNRKGVYLDWYANSPENLSMPPEKFIGVNMKKILSPHEYQKTKASHNRAIESGNIQIEEYSVESNNEVKHHEARVVPMNDHQLLTIVRDITEGKAKDALLNIRNNALTSASNSIMIADAQQQNAPIIYCNLALTKMTGYPKEEVIGKNIHFLQNDDRDQKEVSILKNAIKDGEACNVIVRNYRKDGTMFWNDISITPVHNEDDILTHFIGVQNDVTNKVREEKLKDQTRKILELIVQDKALKTIGSAIVRTMQNYFKDCMASILLLDTDNNTLHKLVAPNLSKFFRNFIEGINIGPKLASCGTAAFLKKEIIVSNIPSNVLWEDYKDIADENGLEACWSFPILSSNKQVLGTIALYSSIPRKPLPEEKDIILDMTHLMSIAIENHNNSITIRENKLQLEKYTQKLEEKVQERTQEVMATVQKLVETNLNLEDQLLITEQAEKNALASKALTSEIAKNFPKGLIVVIGKDLKVQFVEGEALDQLGLRKTIYENLLIDDLTLFSAQRKVLIIDNILKTLSGQHLTFEVKYKKSYFSINTTPLYDENKQIVSALHVYNDISVQKEIEFNLHNTIKKEKELNDLKSRFVSLASHEFRTPLSAILTSAILIGKLNEQDQVKKRERYLAQIERNVNHLVVILNDFLSLSKLEEGEVIAKRKSFDIIKFSEALTNETNIGLKKDQTITMTNCCETLFVNLDPKLLRHVLMNLLSNASKYSSKGSNIDFEISKNLGKVLIQVTDSGIGIPKEEQSYLFQRFFRAKNAENIEGTGLGLNIVKNYTELMGGDIGFKSELNKGTSFWVEFPIQNS